MRSWWLSEAGTGDGEPEPGAPLGGDHRAEVCVVGGGFTGLWTALRIKEHAPQTEVVLVEADICGGGPSGRNGGFALSFWHHFAALELACGRVEALRLAHASADAIDEIGRFCGQHE